MTLVVLSQKANSSNGQLTVENAQLKSNVDEIKALLEEQKAALAAALKENLRFKEEDAAWESRHRKLKETYEAELSAAKASIASLAAQSPSDPHPLKRPPQAARDLSDESENASVDGEVVINIRQETPPIAESPMAESSDSSDNVRMSNSSSNNQRGNYQLVFSDTPGMLSPAYKLQETMQDTVSACIHT